jgi:hypothetical protein
LYASRKIADAEGILQCGLGEPGIQRRGTYKQWSKIKHKGSSMEVVTIEAGWILVGAAAEEVASRVESTWERGPKPTPLAPRPKLLALVRASYMERRVYPITPSSLLSLS